MKPAFTTLGCPNWNVNKIASFAAQNDLAVELRFHVDGNHASPNAPADEWIKQAETFAQHGADVFCMMAYTNFIDPEKVSESIAITRRSVAAAKIFGAKFVRLFVGPVPEGKTRDQLLPGCVEAMKIVAADALRHGIVLAIETHDDWCKPAIIRDLLDRVGNSALKINWDICNAFHAGTKVEEAFPLLKDVIAYCHVKDGHHIKKDGATKWEYLDPGSGEVELVKAFQLLAKSGYSSYLSFEHEKKWIPELKDPEVAFPGYVKWFNATLKKLRK